MLRLQADRSNMNEENNRSLSEVGQL